MFERIEKFNNHQIINRKAELNQLQQALNENKNPILCAPKNFGKTTIIIQFLGLEKKKPFIYIDTKRVINLKHLSIYIIEKIYMNFGVMNLLNYFEGSMFKLFKEFRKNNIEEIGELTIQLFENKNCKSIDYYKHALFLLEQFYLFKREKMILIFDEFQDMKNFLDDSQFILFSKELSFLNNVNFIFSVNSEHVMNKLFFEINSPLKNFAVPLKIDLISIEELVKSSEKYFTSKSIISDESIYLMIKKLSGNPGYTIKAIQYIELLVKINNLNRIDVDICKKAIKYLINDNLLYLEELIIKAKNKKNHFEVLSSIANNQTVLLNPKSLYSVHVSLEELGLIKKIERGEYRIVDILFSIFLEQKDFLNLEIEF